MASEGKWKYYIPHAWEEPEVYWEDIWMKPEGFDVYGNMVGGFINLTIDCIGGLECESENDQELQALADYIKNKGIDYLIFPYPIVTDWQDDVSMIINKQKLTEAEVVEFAVVYLKSQGYAVHTFEKMTESEAFSVDVGETD